jgi:Putative adhesin
MHRAAVLLTALTAACLAAQAHAAEYTKAFPLSGRPTVRVNSNDGGVTVRTSDTNQVEFRVIYKSLTLDRNLHIEATQQGDQLQLNVHEDWQPVSLGLRRLHIEVSMPKDGDLRIETGDGSIEVANLSGNVDLHSGDGELKVRALKGVLRMNTSDGAINGDDLDGKLDAHSGDGRIRLEGRFDELKVKTGDGSVTATVKAGSKIESGWNLQSGDGGIELTLPKDLQADVSASSGDGHVTSDIPLAVQGDFSKSKVNGKLNGGGAPLTIHTGDGSIHLRAG